MLPENEMLNLELTHLKEMLSHKLDGMQKDITEVKEDVKEIRDGVPIYRIEQLEEWKEKEDSKKERYRILFITAFLGIISSIVLSLVM